MKKLFVITLILVTVAAATLAGCAEEAAAPVAEFSGTPTSGEAPLSVQFTDQSTGEITSRSWDFGDGGSSTSQSPSHTYQDAGTYTVEITVTGPDGTDIEIKTDYITVTTPTQLDDIVEIAVADDRFETLVAALQAADLVDTLQGEGPFTVFAPTDDAFDNLPPGTVEALLQDIPALTDVLLYHVVSGKVMAADVVTLTSATTLLGQDVTITVDQGNVYINDAQVIITDIEASNGVIHVIDAVLIP